jgi:hypothetical protein
MFTKQEQVLFGNIRKRFHKELYSELVKKGGTMTPKQSTLDAFINAKPGLLKNLALFAGSSTAPTSILGNGRFQVSLVFNSFIKFCVFF